MPRSVLDRDGQEHPTRPKKSPNSSPENRKLGVLSNVADSPDPERDLRMLLREEPFVRDLARQLCASGRADPEEVAQQTWVRALEHGGGKHIERPRSWLARITRHVMANIARSNVRRRDRERAVARGGLAPSSAELMLREERRQTLVALVDALPAAQREVLLLRYFEGLPPREIAQQLDEPAERIHSRLRQGLDRLRSQLDARSRDPNKPGSRAAYLLPLLAQPNRSTTAASLVPTTFLTGLILMTTKSKLAVASAVLLGAIALIAWPSDPAQSTSGTQIQTNEPAAPMTSAQVPDESARTADRTPSISRTAATTPTETVAPCKVRVTAYRTVESTRTPIPWAMIKIGRAHADYREARRARTDQHGVVEFDQLEPGTFVVWGDRGHSGRTIQAAAGQITECELHCRSKTTLRGRVLDRQGTPIEGAAIEIGLPGLLGRDPECLALTDAAGRFEVLSAPEPSVYCARKAGYRCSPLRMAWDRERQDIEVEIRLDPGGGVVEGHVFDSSGQPIGNAFWPTRPGTTRAVRADMKCSCAQENAATWT